MASIVICNTCSTSYRLHQQSIRGGRVLLLCPGCRNWFSVSVATPEAMQPKTVESTSPESQALPPVSTETAHEQTAPVETSQATDADEKIPVEAEFSETANVDETVLKILLADEPQEFRERIARAIAELNETLDSAIPLELVIVDDGVAAREALTSFTPDLAIIGTGIENVYCFELCDTMRADDRLRHARIVFASSLHPSAWNCAEPESLYGADAWLSNQVAGEDLVNVLRRHLETVRSNQGQPAA